MPLPHSREVRVHPFPFLVHSCVKDFDVFLCGATPPGDMLSLAEMSVNMVHKFWTSCIAKYPVAVAPAGNHLRGPTVETSD